VKTFNSPKEAVSFVMALDEPSKQTATLILPGGPAVNLPVIEQMHAAQQSADGN